jgi:hypothetical protein
VPLGPGSAGHSPQSASVTITVPFAASAHIDMPPGRVDLTCDALFGDEQVILDLFMCVRVCQAGGVQGS